MLVKFDLRKVLQRSVSIHDVIKYIPYLEGQSFLINYIDLKKYYRLYDETDVMNYVILAGRRDYKYALAYDDYALEDCRTVMTLEQINKNKLIWHKDSKIYLRFEEDRAGTLRKRKNGN
jgi:hypothetical protein